jgi:hypothetical protein
MAQSSKDSDTLTDGTVSPWLFNLQKVMAVKAQRDVCNHAMSQAKITMLTKNLTSKAGLARFPNNALGDILLTNVDISNKKCQHSRKNARGDSLKI